MKSRIAIILILLGSFVSAARAQSNCCDIQVSGANKNKTTTTVPAQGATGPGGTYISTETDTYGVSCINSDTGKACNLATTPNNVVTATGAGKNINGNFIACNPSFKTTTSHAKSTSGAAAAFTDEATSYTGIDANGVCTLNPMSPSDESACVVVACSTTTGGGGCSCGGLCPPCSSTGASFPYPKAGFITKTSGKTQTGRVLKVQNILPCCGASPIIIDVGGHGFDLTNASGGVLFDIVGDGHPLQMAWTAQGAANAFLCLPDVNGRCDDGKDLFGNFTPQPPSNSPNGFAALAVYDQPTNGGNGDGIIDSRDAIFASLRLWIDGNHDGISQPEELYTLPSLGVNSISLHYSLSGRLDQYGNYFRYRADVNPGEPTTTGRMAYDVFFVANVSGNALYAGRCSAPTVSKEALLPAKKEGMLADKK